MKRLNEVLKFVLPGVLADVGCDHGYLTILAIKNNIASHAYALDINELPLENARKNIVKNNLEDKIDLILSDGLQKLPNNIDTLTICGMGGILIKDIIEKNIEKLKNIKRIIIEPNNNQDCVRRFLNQKGFKIVDESLVYEKSHIYEIIVYEHGMENLSEKQIIFGPINLIKKEELFLKKYENIINSLEKSLIHASDESKKTLNEKINFIKESIGGI